MEAVMGAKGGVRPLLLVLALAAAARAGAQRTNRS